MAALPSKFMATAPWWKIYLAVAPIFTVGFAASGARRFDGAAWIWLGASGPVVAALVTWVLVRIRSRDKAAGLDPVAAAKARELLETFRVADDPAGREMARQVLPGLIRQYRTLLWRGIVPVCTVAAVVFLVLGAVTGEPAWFVGAAIAVVVGLIVLVVFRHYLRRYERMLRELGQASTVGSW